MENKALGSEKIFHGDIEMTFCHDGDGNKLNMLRMKPVLHGAGTDEDAGSDELYSQPNFQMTVAGCNYGIQEGVNIGGSQVPHDVRLKDFRHDESGAEFVYVHDILGLEITLHMTFIKGANVIRQYNTVKNIGDSEKVITHFSSANICGIEPLGKLPWDHPGKFMIHYCVNTWQGEGQWRSVSLEDAGIYSCSVHQNTNTFRLSSTGSWSTSRFMPFILLENTETKQIWYAQIETSSAWHFEVGHRKKGPGMRGEMYITADGADENTSGWHIRLHPGESFDTVPCAFGCVNGGFEEAVCEMTKYRRSHIKPVPAWENEAPLFFNDYMNCLWADPSEDKLIPLIDAACEAGAEGFCIDAGWFGISGKPWGNVLGDWEPSPDRFGKGGLKCIIDYITSKGMRAGLWIEFESCGKDAALYAKDDSYFLTRSGERIGGERAMPDFRNPHVREYMHGVFDRLIDMGVTYFKNDYNQSAALGDDKYTESAAEGLIEHIRAVYSFIDEVRAKHPGVIIEACAGGGLRGDNGMASHCHLLNTSDQEIYTRYPSVIQGSLACILPEQATIWSYPWPLLILKASDPSLLSSHEYMSEMTDGEQTVFNMINGMCGNMLLSGRIDRADGFNRELIKKGCAYYKSIRKYTHSSVPFYPIGLTRINKEAYAAFGLRNDDARKMFIAVWRINAPYDSITLDLKKCITGAKVAYQAGTGVAVHISEGSRITVDFTKKLQAAFIEADYK